MLRLICRAPLAVAILAAGMLAVPAVSGAASTRTCKLSGGAAQDLGPAYVFYAPGKPGYRVRGTTCANGKNVIRSFHACRLDKGDKGRCTREVRGYRCSDERSDIISTQFDGAVSCRNGTRRVTHHYTQRTSD